MHSETNISRVVPLLAALLAAAPATVHAQQPAAAPAPAAQSPGTDSSLLGHIAVMARQKAIQLAAGQPAPPPAALTQYREALGDIDRGDLAGAAPELAAVLARAPRNPQFRGDLAYVYA